MRLSYSVSTFPNRDRGYDAHVTIAHRGEDIGGQTFNAPSETAARALADAFILADKKATRATRAVRALSDGALESMEAARNERDYR